MIWRRLYRPSWGAVSILSFLLPFYVLSVTSFVAFVVISIRLKESPKPPKVSFTLQMSRLGHYLEDGRFAKTLMLIVVFYALINIYYSFLSLFLNDEGISVPAIGVIHVALLPAVALEVPMGHLMDKQGIRRTLSLAVVASAVTALIIPLSQNLYFTAFAVTTFHHQLYCHFHCALL